MLQRLPSTWQMPPRPGRRPRVLVESPDPALAVSDFTLYREAGFDTALCSGPGAGSDACPLLRGQPCPLVAGADVILNRLDPELGLVGVIRRQRPDLPVLTTRVVTPTASVDGQLHALRRALGVAP